MDSLVDNRRNLINLELVFRANYISPSVDHDFFGEVIMPGVVDHHHVGFTIIYLKFAIVVENFEELEVGIQVFTDLVSILEHYDRVAVVNEFGYITFNFTCAL